MIFQQDFARICGELAKYASFIANHVCLVARALLAFTKPLDFVASELLILVKSKSFVVGSSRVRWSLSGLLKKNVKVVARYSHEPASSTKASTLKDGSGSMKTSLFIENNYAGLA